MRSFFYNFRICNIELFCSPIFQVYDRHTYFQHIKQHCLADRVEFPWPSIHRFHKARLGHRERLRCLKTCIQLGLVRVVQYFFHWNLEVPWPSSISTILGIVHLEVDCSLLNDQVQPFKHSAPEVYCLAFKLSVVIRDCAMTDTKVLTFRFTSSIFHWAIMFHD